MYCRFCGKEIDNDSDFCNYCGKSLANSDSKEASLIKNEVNTDVKKEPETKRTAGAEAAIFVIICIGIGISMLAGYVNGYILEACGAVFGILLIVLALRRTQSIHNVMVCLLGGAIHMCVALYNSIIRLIQMQAYIEAGFGIGVFFGGIIRFISGVIIIFVALIFLKKKKTQIKGDAVDKTYFIAWVGVVYCVISFFIFGWHDINIGAIIYIAGLIILLIASILTKRNYTRIVCMVMGFINLIVAVLVLTLLESWIYGAPIFVIALTTVIISGVKVAAPKTKK